MYFFFCEYREKKRQRERKRVKHTSRDHAAIVNGQPCTYFITVCVCNNSCAGLFPLPVSQFDACLSFKSGRSPWNHITCLAVCVSAPTVNRQSNRKICFTYTRRTLSLNFPSLLTYWLRMQCSSNFMLLTCLIYYTLLHWEAFGMDQNSTGSDQVFVNEGFEMQLSVCGDSVSNNMVSFCPWI